MSTEALSPDAFVANAKFDIDGLVPAVAQDAKSGSVLMVAWMNRDALAKTLRSGDVTYWSRSRKALWRKGETSGHTQKLVEAWLDCDGDTVLLKVDQQGPACHTGAPTCFFRMAKV
jgi:phosphoribosyl-AMP cyclohydrolase